MSTVAADNDLQIPRDRAGTLAPALVPRGSRRTGGPDEMIISLYAGGMTVRDIAYHLETTIGTQLSHDTISKITDEVLEEVAAPQERSLETAGSTRSSTWMHSHPKNPVPRESVPDGTSQRTALDCSDIWPDHHCQS